MDRLERRTKQIFWLGAAFFFVMGVVLKITDTSVQGRLVSKYGNSWQDSVVNSTASFIFCGVFLLILYFFFRKPKKNKNNQ